VTACAIPSSGAPPSRSSRPRARRSPRGRSRCRCFDLPQPFLAPWAALLTVHATVYRTFARGLQQVAAAVLGVLLAVVVGSAFGINAASLGAMLIVALAAGTTRALRDESTTAAATGSSSS
jgi:uncharacterized membrane protein YgaE (UPF0421/DUF939 family)